jgi:hypothetical protein
VPDRQALLAAAGISTRRLHAPRPWRACSPVPPPSRSSPLRPTRRRVGHPNSASRRPRRPCASAPRRATCPPPAYRCASRSARPAARADACSRASSAVASAASGRCARSFARAATDSGWCSGAAATFWARRSRARARCARKVPEPALLPVVLALATRPRRRGPPNGERRAADVRRRDVLRRTLRAAVHGTEPRGVGSGNGALQRHQGRAVPERRSRDGRRRARDPVGPVPVRHLFQNWPDSCTGSLTTTYSPGLSLTYSHAEYAGPKPLKAIGDCLTSSAIGLDANQAKAYLAAVACHPGRVLRRRSPNRRQRGEVFEFEVSGARATLVPRGTTVDMVTAR